MMQGWRDEPADPTGRLADGAEVAVTGRETDRAGTARAPGSGEA